MIRFALCACSLLALSAASAQAQDISDAFADHAVGAESLETVRGKHVAESLKDALRKGVGGAFTDNGGGSGYTPDNGAVGGNAQFSFTDNHLDGGNPMAGAQTATGASSMQNSGMNNPTTSGNIRDGMMGLIMGTASGAVGPR